MKVLHADMLTVLSRLYDEVRKVVSACRDNSEQQANTNAKGDLQYQFDLSADDAIRRFLQRELDDGIVLSEECDAYRWGASDPVYRFVVDPVDGSDNYKRGLPLCAVSVAVLPVDVALAVGHVLWAMVGDLEKESVITATRHKGAFRGGKSIRVSDVRHVEDAFLSCEMNHHAPSARLGILLERARGIRTYGCCSRAIALVTTGALDAHIDVRGTLTPESFLAASLALSEAGGCLMGLDGKPVSPLQNLTDRTSIVAAATPQLAQEIIGVLSDDGLDN